jgi:hypothetical protein
LDNQAQDNFLFTQSNKTKNAVLKAFDREPTLRELCRNQLLFLLAVELIPSSKNLGLRRTDLYSEFILRYFDWLDVRPLEKPPIIAFIAELAFEMRKSLKSGTLIRNHRMNELINEKAEFNGIHISRMLYRYGLAEKRGNYTRFFQETFQEYLCAYYLVSKGIRADDLQKKDGRLFYKNVELTDVIGTFMAELT